MFLPLLQTTTDVGLAWSAPFALLLACIALMPFVARHWWERHYPKVAIGLALIPAVYYFAILRMPGYWLSAMSEYVSFILLLSALFVISGGIVIRVNRRATPLANCTMLAIGAVIANVFGTTGASMLLIRPYLRMNRGHLKPFHIAFFIFTVANCGGLLTPIGDPPLFLGYLNGVPFRWTMDHLWRIWLTCNGLLLLLFFIIDTLDHRKYDGVHPDHGGPQVHILGIHNLLFIAVVLFALFRPGFFESANRLGETAITARRLGDMIFSRELLMVAATALSLALTPKDVYKHNEFSYGPMKEVAILFVGIFSTMAPALGYLEQHADELRIKTPSQFYFTSGILSSILDNAPTYLALLKVRLGEIDPGEVKQAQEIVATMAGSGRLQIPESLPDGRVRKAVEAAVEHHADLIRDNSITPSQVQVAFLIGDPALNAFIIAISAGSVLFGACTYIGNGPNFMIKSIADTHGCPTPSFMGYILRYSLPILLPVYLFTWLIFLRA